MNIEQIVAYAREGKPLPTAVNYDKRMMHALLSVLSEVASYGMDGKRRNRLENIIIKRCEEIRADQERSLSVCRREQLRIRASEECLIKLLKSKGSTEEKLRLACDTIASMRGGCEHLYEQIGGSK